MNSLISGLAAREPAGGGRPGRYLPVSTPWPSGEKTIWEMPFAVHRGITLASGRRHSIEYIGWLEAHRSTPGRSRDAWIWLGLHSLNPMWRALPDRTASVSASIVSSSGVSGS